MVIFSLAGFIGRIWYFGVVVCTLGFDPGSMSSILINTTIIEIKIEK